MRSIRVADPHEAWDTPAYYEPVRIRPEGRSHALSVSLALCVLTTGLIGTLVYHRLDSLSDINTYATMGPSQSHIAADQASAEPTLLVTLPPPVYAAVTRSDAPGVVVPAAAQVHGADAAAISQYVANDDEAKAAESVASDSAVAPQAEVPVAADSLPAVPDPVAVLLSETSTDD